MARSTALIAGDAGFPGSHFCERLLANGHEVVCLNNFVSGRPENVAHLTDDERFLLLEAGI